MIKLLGWAMAIAMVAAAGPSAAQPKKVPPPKPAAASSVKLPELETWTLPNGLRVAYMGLHKAPVVTVQVWYHVGAKEEARNRRGSAHMFEHMMFKGTKHVRPEEHARHLNRVGGYVNAFTTEDVTAYHDTVPREYLDFAMQLEAERMSNLLFRKKMVDTEREVVKEEIRQQENNPIAKGFLRFLSIAYKKHPYSWTAGGTIADLDQTSPDDLAKFYETYYVPNNALLVVVGDVDKGQVEDAATRWFGGLTKGAKPPRPADASPEPEQTKMRREVAESGQIGLIIGGYHIPEATSADIYPLQVLSLILGAGDSSRLHKRLVRTDKTAVEVGAQSMVREHPGLLLVFAAYLDGGNQQKVEDALFDEIDRIARSAPSARELTKAKNQINAGFVFGLESVTGLANEIGMSWVQSGDPGRFLDDLGKIDAVTAQDVQRVAAKYLKKSNRTVVVIPPAGKGGK